MGDNKDILIVEDEVLAAQSIELNLIKSGFNICGSVHSAKDAIENAKTKKPSIILMDIKLFGPIDGIEAVYKIKTFLNAHIIFMSGYSDAVTRKRAMKANPTAFLDKPINFIELKKIIIQIQESQ